ncbi:G-type lectin S-receptor-like serine/threonine-protein kinase LECRK1 [Tripterygium wilfordii]|uniref:G-type lectin S-receptor-like serine/threonine-protein kinase LECRK1 n=1 Tax=Tripterygium wilfordii TaxID=458696 RepID=UPI0018F80937|nr:G-type lectin S-receptor-like serine/threonine-protein kinase LECRK1 [Tripterygium wilfordii]
MSNGTLASFLFGISRPDWNKRVKIALGMARGFTYLHEKFSAQIIHCDIKPQNILLNESFTARISAFGLAKLLMSDQTRTQTVIRGSRGYVAPEWFRNKPITAKVYVYSYGVTLLVIICCRKSLAMEMENEEAVTLLDKCPHLSSRGTFGMSKVWPYCYKLMFGFIYMYV